MKTNYQDQTTDIYGKVPPQAINEEEAVLGALILEKNAYHQVSDILTAESFYKEDHQKIFSVIKSLHDECLPVDSITVSKRLKSIGELDAIGGIMYLIQLTSKVASAGHIEYHARIIAQCHIARSLIRITSEWGAKAYDDQLIDEVLSGLQNDIISLSETGAKTETTIYDSSKKLIDRINKNRETSGGLTGIGTGISKLDHFTGGLQGSDLIVVAGETSHGKTSMALTILKNAVLRYNAKAAVYSLEMSDTQLTARIVAQESNVSSKTILNKSLYSDEYDRVINTALKIGKLPVFFDPSSTSTVESICASVRRLKMKHGINLVVIDYLQLIGSLKQNKSDESQIADITRKFKNIAKDLDIPVILISQLSRDGNNHKPSKHRLRGSGQIEEAADIILFVWRPDEYGIKYFDEPHENTETKGLAECIIDKGRNVGTGSFLLRFDYETTGFYDYAPEYENQNINPDYQFESRF